MGRGRRFPHFWWYAVLIATAIQGITPDPQDLASQKLLRVICPMVGSDPGSQDQHESVGQVYEPVRVDQGSRIPQVAPKTPLPGRIAFISCRQISSPVIRRVAAHCNEALRHHGLIHTIDPLRL
jgi:hypothetical protein